MTIHAYYHGELVWTYEGPDPPHRYSDYLSTVEGWSFTVCEDRPPKDE